MSGIKDLRIARGEGHAFKQATCGLTQGHDDRSSSARKARPLSNRSAPTIKMPRIPRISRWARTGQLSAKAMPVKVIAQLAWMVCVWMRGDCR